MGEIRFCIGDVRDGETRVGGLRLADGRISDSIFESRRRVERFSESNFGADDTPRLVVGCKLNFAAVTRRSPSDKSRLYADHSPCTGNSIQFFSFFFLSDVTVTGHGVSQSVTVSYFTVPLRAHPSAFSFNNLLNDERQVEA